MQTLLSRTKSLFNSQLLVEVICYAFVILFVYAGLYKILDFQVFILSLKQSPVISPIAGILAYVVPYGEIVVAALLLVRKSRLLGLFLATGIMAGFTVYIGYMLIFVPDLPCQCGGIIAKMGWKEHLIFNSCFTAMGIWATILQKKAHRP